MPMIAKVNRDYGQLAFRVSAAIRVAENVATNVADIVAVRFAYARPFA